jgi:hypothetical protein
MDKKIAVPAVIAVLAALIVAGAAYAQNTGGAAQDQVPGQGHPLVGIGTAVSNSDATNFSPLAVAFADRLDKTSNTTQLTGRIQFNSERFDATSIEVAADGTVTGSLERNATVVGSFRFVPVANTTRWTGSLTVDSQQYNAYILAAPRGGFGLGKMFEHKGWVIGHGQAMGMKIGHMPMHKTMHQENGNNG